MKRKQGKKRTAKRTVKRTAKRTVKRTVKRISKLERERLKKRRRELYVEKRYRHKQLLKRRRELYAIRRALIKRLRRKRLTYEEYKKLRAYKQTHKPKIRRQARRKHLECKRLFLVVRSTWYKQKHKARKKKTTVQKYRNKARTVFTRVIDRSNKVIVSRYEYIPLTVQDISDTDRMRDKIQRKLQSRRNAWIASEYQSMTASIQLLQGPFRDKWTASLDEGGDASKMIYLPAVDKYNELGSEWETEQVMAWNIKDLEARFDSELSDVLVLYDDLEHLAMQYPKKGKT